MRRATTGGMIRQHPGRELWEARYVGADGRKHSLYAKTQREAQDRLREALTDASQGIRPLTTKLTVAAYLDEWIAGPVKTTCRPRTVESYSETVRRYIAPRHPKDHPKAGEPLPAPALGCISLSKLQPSDVDAMLGRLTARGDLSPTTVRYTRTVLRIALGRALKIGLVRRNVAALASAPPRVSRELHPLSAEQVRSFLAATAGDRHGPLFTVAVATGLRLGELLALRWADIDDVNGTLAVRHTLDRSTGELAEPKTERSRRTLRLSRTALAALRVQRARQAADQLAAGKGWRRLDHVFASSTGGPLDSWNVRHRLQAALLGAGLPRVTFHTFGRHGFASLMLEAGEELAVISRSLGHSTLSTTADIYLSILPAVHERAADRMDALLTG